MNKASSDITLAVTLILFVPSGALPSGKHGQHGVLNLCELLDNWQNYNQHEVRVRAVYAVGPVTDWLYDPSCREGEGATAVEFRDHLQGAVGKMDRIVSKGRRQRRAWVIFEGVFHGPEPYKDTEIDQTPPPLREQVRKGHRRYGHMDMFDSMIEVTKVVEATKVADDVPDSKINSDRKIYPDLH